MEIQFSESGRLSVMRRMAGVGKDILASTSGGGDIAKDIAELELERACGTICDMYYTAFGEAEDSKCQLCN